MGNATADTRAPVSFGNRTVAAIVSDFFARNWECTDCGYRLTTGPMAYRFCFACDPYWLRTPTLREVLAPYRIVIVVWQPS